MQPGYRLRRGLLVATQVARHGVNINAVVLGNPPHPSRTEERQDYLNRLSHFDRVGALSERNDVASG